MARKKKKKKKTSKKGKAIAKQAKNRGKLTFSSVLGLFLGFSMAAVGLYGVVAQNNPVGFIFVLFGAIVAGLIFWMLYGKGRK